MKKQALKKMLSALLSLFIVLCLALLVYVIVASNSKNIFGYRIFIVKTDSMMDTLAPKDLIITREYPENELQIDDIITFYSNDPNIKGFENTHRIVRIENGTFYTKGDAAEFVDRTAVTYADIIGKVTFKSTILGHIITFLSKPIWMLVLIVIPIAFFAFFDIKTAVEKIIKIVRKKEEIPEEKNPELNEDICGKNEDEKCD